MDRGGEAAGSTELGMAGAVRGIEVDIGSGAFVGHLGTAAAAPGSFSEFGLSAVAGRGVVPVVLVGPQFHLHRHHEPVPGGVEYPNDIGGASWRQLRQVDVVVLVGQQLPGGVVPVQGNYGYYSALQPRPGQGARRGVVLGELFPGGGGGAVHDDYSLFPGGVGAPHDNYAYYALQPRSGAGHGEVLVGQLPAGAEHGEVFVGVLPGGIDAAYDDYGYYPLQPRRPGVGSDEVLTGPLADGVGVVFGRFPAPGTRRADGIAGYDGSGALADDPGVAYNNRGTLSELLLRLLPLVGIGACSVAVNGLAAGPGSPDLAFHLFALLLGGLFLLTLHVLRV